MRYKQPIIEAPISNILASGIHLSGGLGGLIPKIVEYRACRYAGIPLTEWEGLDYDDKVSAIAFYTVEMSVSSHINDAQIEASRKKSK